MDNQLNSVAPHKKQIAYTDRFFFKKEIENISISELENLKQNLEFLCLQFDPYDPNEPLETCKEIIQTFGLKDSLSNPFDYTNQVLTLMDLIETEISRRSSLDTDLCTTLKDNQ